MPKTPDHGLRYPGPDEQPDPRQVEHLAEDTDAAIVTLALDSGVRSDIDISPEDGWSMVEKSYHTIGKKLYLHVRVQRDGATITADGTAAGQAPGNIPDTTVATIDDATLLPVMDTYGYYRCRVTGGSAQVNADGRIRIVDAHTTSTIANGDGLDISITYPIA